MDGRPGPRRPPISLATLEDARSVERRILDSVRLAGDTLAGLLENGEPLEAFRAMKFRRIGADPFQPENSANLLEQIHQTFFFLVMVRAAEYLLHHHPEHAPFTLNVGSGPGPDIVSADGAVAAETFAAITPRNNNKLTSDLEKMRACDAEHRYVFYHAEEGAGSVSDPEVRIVDLDI